jgi:hypothetical protein
MTMTGMITAQIVISHRPGTMTRMSPIVIAMPARIEAAATDQNVRRGRGHGLADGQVGAAVPHVLDRLDQRRLQQEGREELDDGAEQRPEDPGQREQARHDGRGHVDHKGDREQVPGVRPVHAPRFAQYARQRVHGQDRTSVGKK